MKVKPILLSEEEVSRLKEEGNYFINFSDKAENSYYRHRAEFLDRMEELDEVDYYAYEIVDDSYPEYKGQLFKVTYGSGDQPYYDHVVVKRVFKSFFDPEVPYSVALKNGARPIDFIDNIVDVSKLKTPLGDPLKPRLEKIRDSYINQVTDSLELMGVWGFDKFPTSWWYSINNLDIEERPWKTLPVQHRWALNAKNKATGRYRGGSLIMDSLRSLSDIPFFTFYPEDVVFVAGPYKGLYLWSLPKLYNKFGDPTEFQFAMEVFGDFGLWQKLCSMKTVLPFIEEMRENLKYMMKSKIVAKMMDVVEEGGPRSFQAAKWLSEQGWNIDATTEKKAVGRPKKEVQEEDDVPEDVVDLIKSFKKKVEVEK